MKNIFVKIAAITSLSLIATFSQASLIGSIAHDYGSQQYIASSLVNPVGSCDTMNADSVTIRSQTNSCNPFYDLFDLSSINYDTIDYFELTLSFSESNRGSILAAIFGGAYEQWGVRPASSTSVGASTQPNIGRVAGLTTKTFTFNASNTNVFDGIVDNKTFYLWMSDNGPGDHSFNLADAKLDVFGTLAEVPEPAPLALLSLSLIALALSKRRKN